MRSFNYCAKVELVNVIIKSDYQMTLFSKQNNQLKYKDLLVLR